MFGTEASLAGIQNRLTVSMRNDAASRCSSAVLAVGDRPDDRDRQEQHEAQQVADDHGRAAVPAVGEGAGERPEQHRRQQAEDEHAAGRERLALEGVDELRRERRRGQEAEPVAEARQHQRGVELAERRQAQHGPGAAAGQRRDLRRRGSGSGRASGRECSRVEATCGAVPA